jgi:hypothetical protein
MRRSQAQRSLNARPHCGRDAVTSSHKLRYHVCEHSLMSAVVVVPRRKRFRPFWLVRQSFTLDLETHSRIETCDSDLGSLAIAAADRHYYFLDLSQRSSSRSDTTFEIKHPYSQNVNLRSAAKLFKLFDVVHS